jgi:hypothetical protein
MIDQVDHTLKLWRQSLFQWGKTDCMLSLSDYLHRCGGPDIAAQFRGTYDDEAGAMAHIKRCGGVEGIIAMAGLEEIDPNEAERGDIVVLNPGGSQIGLGAIITGPCVAARTERSVVEISRRFVNLTHAWRILPCQP